MQLSLNKYVFVSVWAVIGLTVVAHLALCGLPLINLEWAFADAARYFQSHNQDFLDRYFAVQANSLGIPLLAYLMNQVLPFIDIGMFPRLVAISGFVLLGWALIRLNDLTGRSAHPALLVALVFLNPLVWVFGGRGTADFFPAALALFSVSLFWDKRRSTSKLILAIVTFSLAIILKYHAILLLPLVWIESLTRFKSLKLKAFAPLTLITAAIVIVPAIYLCEIRKAFGFWFTPPVFQNTHDLSLSPAQALTNFVSYTGYLALLLLPFSFVPVWRSLHNVRQAITVGAACVILFLGGYLWVAPNGEMNFGPLDAYLSTHVVGGIFCVCAGLFFKLAKAKFSEAVSDSETRRILVCTLIGVILFIGVLAFTRPAQRYLLFVLPLAYLFAAPLLKNDRWISCGVITLCVVMNAYIAVSQYATGVAAVELTQKIEDSGLIALTNPDAILGHTGNAFPVALTPKTYIVVAGKSANQVLFAESMPMPFVHKAFSLVRLQPEASAR